MSTHKTLRWMVGALTIVAIAALTACASPTPAPTTASGQAPAAKPAGATQLTKDNITLRVLTAIFPGEQGKTNFEEVLLGDFKKKYPNIKFEIQYLPDYNRLNETLTTAYASGQPPDVFNIGVGWFETFAGKGQLLEMDSLVTKATELDDYYPGTLEPAKWKDKLYGIPYVMDLRLIVYRKDMFKEAGLDPDKPPTTWEELRNAAIKLTKRGADGKIERDGLELIQLGRNGSEVPRQHWYRFLWQNGGELFNKEGTAAAFNSKEGVEALEFWANLIKQDKVDEIGFSSGIPNISLFTSEKAAMGMAHNRDWVQQIEPLNKPELKDKIGIVPPLKRVRQGEFVGGSYWTIAKQTKYPKEAWAVVEYLTQKENLLTGNKMRGAVPPRKSLANDPFVANNPYVKAAMEQYLPVTMREGGVPCWLEIRGLFDPAIMEVVTGTKTAKQALDGVAAQTNDILKRCNQPAK